METKFEKVRAIEDDIEAIKKVKHFFPREGERSWRDLMAEQGALHLAKTLVGTRDNREEERVVVGSVAFYLGPDELLS